METGSDNKYQSQNTWVSKQHSSCDFHKTTAKKHSRQATTSTTASLFQVDTTTETTSSTT
eukprot:3344618-Amphidinium_carterae.1